MWRKRDWKSAAATNVIVYESLRGGDTLHRAYHPGFAINVGNATNLLGLRRVIESRSRYGPTMAFAITEETECMMRQSARGPGDRTRIDSRQPFASLRRPTICECA